MARCGAEAQLGFFSAAALWLVVERDSGWPSVIVPKGAVKAVRGIRVHQTRRPTERCERRSIPVTSLHRTIDDCATTLAPAGIKAMLRQAEYHHSIDLEALAGEARSRRLKAALRLYVPGQGKTDSELEADFFELSHRAGLPAPLLQRSVPGGRVDFLYPTLRLIVEVDGYAAHRGRVAFRDDRARDRANRARGYDTIRFTWEDVQFAADAVVADLESEASRASTVASTKS